MKEAFLAGLLSMGANADDNDINIMTYAVPITVTQNGQEVNLIRYEHHYAITANDTKADVGPQVTRHISLPTK